jgi:hypothetical protein
MFQSQFDGGYLFGSTGRDVGDSLVFDPAIFPEGSSEQVAGVGAGFGGDGGRVYMHSGYILSYNIIYVKQLI